MKKGIIGKKIGMTQIFDANGNVIPVTVIEAGPCTVTQKKTVETDGYDAIQNFCNGSAVADLEGVDAVSGCTLVDTAGYVAEIVKAAK